MKSGILDPGEIEYCCSLDWDSLMIYLEKKHGKEFKEQFVKNLKNKIQKQMDDEKKDEELKWKL